MFFLGPAAEASPAETQHSGDTVDHHQDQFLAIPVVLLALGGQLNATFLLVPEFRWLNHVDSNILILKSHQLKFKSHTKFEGSIPHWLLPEGKKQGGYRRSWRYRSPSCTEGMHATKTRPTGGKNCRALAQDLGFPAVTAAGSEENWIRL